MVPRLWIDLARKGTDLRLKLWLLGPSVLLRALGPKPHPANVVNPGISRKTLQWGDLPGRAISNLPRSSL